MGLTISRLGSPSPAALQTPSPATADIIFLDIDGVLNSRSTRENGDHLPDDALLSNLKHAIMHAHRSCLIVLSSTWRLDEALRRPLAEHLLRAGLSIYGFTPDLEKEHTGDRVDEIRAWLQVHCGAMKEEELMAIPWVAIDDLDLLAMNPKLREEHFVRTNDGTGLTRENAEQVILKLRRLREQRSSTRDHERDGASPFAP